VRTTRRLFKMPLIYNLITKKLLTYYWKPNNSVINCSIRKTNDTEGSWPFINRGHKMFGDCNVLCKVMLLAVVYMSLQYVSIVALQ
jgi:hypothetical protein